jgi:hypothetical protein
MIIADFQDLSPRSFHHHSPIFFMIMQPTFSGSFTHPGDLRFLAACFLLGNHSVTGSSQPPFVALLLERKPVSSSKLGKNLVEGTELRKLSQIWLPERNGDP